ncbi:hypothetical protein RhiirA4_482285 [Rhizophagus irregularis]|uniref:Uncharacterized protein n=1 Tax=Rhizophagus irregularis TaxID=588596 RepID=A0A2I1HKT7_9GLOM|nr:hypothetical protein RhiirA4_482285 [Rhizophagus irregularis]
MEETLKQYMNEYYRGFTGFQLEYLEDFGQCLQYFKKLDLAEYETNYLDKDIDTLMNIAVFIMKLGGETVKRILETILLGNFQAGAANDTTADELKKMKDELNSWITKYNEEEKKIDNLEKEKKIAEERIKSLENDVLKLQELEQKMITGENSISSKPKSKTKSHDQRRKSKKKKSSTQEIRKGKIIEIPVKITSDDDYLNKHFADRSRDLRFYNFPAYWKDEEQLKNVGYIERLEVKRNYKYKTVRVRIRLTKVMEETFVKGEANIAIKKNAQNYYFRMFDAKMSPEDIKKRYSWQAYKKIAKLPGQDDTTFLKIMNSRYGGHFSKIIKINKIRYILIYLTTKMIY